MKMLSLLFSLILLSLQLACDRPVQPMKRSNFTIGQKWCFQRVSWFHCDSGQKSWTYPDTMRGYYNYSAVAETTMEDKIFTIIQCDYIDKGPDFVFKNTNWYAAAWMDDSVIVYEYNKDNMMIPPGGLFKTSSQQTYDTTRFFDYFRPYIFGFTSGKEFEFRGTGDPHGHLQCKRKYEGKEQISITAGTFLADKFDWMVYTNFSSSADSFDYVHWDTTLTAKSWTTSNGCIKTVISSNNSDITDSIGQIIGKSSGADTTELIGYFNILADTVQPAGN